MVLLGMTAALAACGLLNGGYSYRYRITVEVDTPEGMRSGSSVWETRQWEGSGIPDRSIRSAVKGEAVVVDLPGGSMFALLRAQDMNVNYASNIVYSHLLDHPDPGVQMSREADGFAGNMRAIAKVKPAFELYPDEYPLLVRFRDTKDPASVEKVDPADLAASFGPGARLRRITVAVTDDAVTTGIENRFAWWSEYRERHFNSSSTISESMKDTQLAAHLSTGDFSTEFNR